MLMQVMLLIHNFMKQMDTETFCSSNDGSSIMIMQYAVVWNPWEKKVSDLGVEDYKRFVAVEPVAVEKPIKLKPGQEWKGVLQVSVVPSGCSRKSCIPHT